MTEPTTDEPATPTSPRNRLDLILALCAIFISAVSLVVAIQQSRTERSLVAADTWPYLQRILNNEYDGHRTIAIGVSNDGVGPAKIKSVAMFFDGRPVASGIDLLRQCCGLDTGKPIPPQLPGGFESSIVDETVLRAGQDNPMLKFHEAEGSSAVVDRLRASLLKISFKACYCSTLDQCWTSDLRTTAITPVAECKPPEHPFDPNGR